MRKFAFCPDKTSGPHLQGLQLVAFCWERREAKGGEEMPDVIDLVSSDDDAAERCGPGAAPEVISLDSPQVRPQASPAPVPVEGLPRSLAP